MRSHTYISWAAESCLDAAFQMQASGLQNLDFVFTARAFVGMSAKCKTPQFALWLTFFIPGSGDSESSW